MAKKTKTVITDLGEKIGGARKDQAVKTGPRVARTPKDTDDTPAWSRRYKVMQDIDRQTKQPKGTFSIIDFDKNSRFGGRTILSGLTSEADAAAKIPLAAVSRNHTVRMTKDNQFEIWRKVTDRKTVKVVPQQFTSRDEAMTHMAMNAQKILETKTGFGEEILAKPEIARRTGPNVRSLGDIAGDSFMKALGMRGVEFGNWQGDRQHVMNHAYDAFADLGHVTGIDPKDLSLKSDLGIAFGARGHGLSSARAHYEPDYGAINLTKMEGAGALAHEWFHALDHMLGRTDDPRLAEKVEKGGAKVYKNAVGDAIFGSHRVAGYVPQKNMPEPVRAAYKGLMDTLYHKDEQFTEDAAKVQKFSDRTAQDINERIDSMRKGLSEKLPDYFKRNNKPASEAQLKRFDAIAAKVKSGAEKVVWQSTPSKKSRWGTNSRFSSPAVEELSNLYKEVRGRTGFDSQKQRGVMDELVKSMRRHGDRQKLVADSAAQTVKTRKIPTEFSREAHRIDEGRVKDYWSTQHEMAARAFSSYVEDKLGEYGRQSDYLSYGSDNKYYRIQNIKPFPEGPERAAINSKFDDLFKAMRESGIVKGATEKGLNLGWSAQAREASAEVRTANAAAKPEMQIAANGDKTLTKAAAKKLLDDAKALPKSDPTRALKIEHAKMAANTIWRPDGTAGSKMPKHLKNAPIELHESTKAALSKTKGGRKTLEKLGHKTDMFGGPTVKDEIAAKARKMDAKGRTGDPANEGLFGSGMKQTDLVDAAKAAGPQPGDLYRDKRGGKYVVDSISDGKIHVKAGKYKISYQPDQFSRALTKVGKLGMAAMIGAPFAAGLVAYDATKRTASAEGKTPTQSTVAAGKAAAVAGSTVAAMGYAVSKGIEFGAKAVSAIGPTAEKVVGRTVPGLGLGLMAYGAYEGFGRHGTAGAILGAVGMDAVLDIPKAPTVGGGKGRAAGFAQANATYKAKMQEAAPSGNPHHAWDDKARAMSAAVRAAKGHATSTFKG